MVEISKFVRDLADKIAYNVNNDPMFRPTTGIFDLIKKAVTPAAAKQLIIDRLIPALETKIKGYKMDKLNPKAPQIFQGFNEVKEEIKKELEKITPEKIMDFETKLKEISKMI